MTRPLALACATLALLLATAARADARLDELAREVDRVESVRAVKTLQGTYAQYAQFGLWEELGELFTREGTFVFDGLVRPARIAPGPAAISRR
jgi:hypothetical protein